MQYAYIRVSSADQNTARQEEALLKAGFQPDKIYVEHASAKDTNRPELQKLLEQLRPGDTLLVHSIDRLCRNMIDMCAVTTREAQNQRPTKNPIPDVVWRYSCIRTSGVSVQL